MYMKSTLPLLFAVTILAVCFTSCSNNGPKEAKYIPKNASAVIVLDPGAMEQKLKSGGINMDTLIGKIFRNDSIDKADKAKLNHFRTDAGINWNSQFYFFVTNESKKEQSSTTVMSVIGGLENAAKFESWIKNEESIKNKDIKKEKAYSYLMADAGTMLSWTDKNIIITIYNQSVKPVYDTVEMRFIVPEKINSDTALKATVNGYYTQDKNASMASVNAFTEMFKQKADGYFFSSTSNALPGLSMMPFQLPKLEEMVKDNYSTATLAFEDGKILVTSASYTNPLISNILKEYAGPTVNLSLIEKYPSEHINGIMLAAFNPEIFGGFLKQLEVEGLVNEMMGKTGFTVQDLYKSLKGDIAVIVSDLGYKQPDPLQRKDEKTLVAKSPIGKMIFNATVGDKAGFFKLMDKAAELGYVSKQGNVYKGGSLLSALGLYLQADDKYLIMASDSLLYTQYVANTGKAVINTEALNRFKGKSTVAYFDIANTIAGFMDENSASDYANSMRKAKETFKDFIATSDNFDGKAVKAVAEIRMQNEKQNSLVTLTSLLTDIAVDMRVAARREKEMEDKMFPGGIPAIIRTN